MSEMFFNSYIGDEIDITVSFDYSASDPDTDWEESVTINSVLVDGDSGKDILSIINDEAMQKIESECYAHVKWRDEVLNDYAEAMLEDK
jgi:hypothetical protein